MLRKTSLVRAALIVLSETVLASAVAAAPAEVGPGPTHYIYRGEAVHLRLDGSRLAVRFGAGALSSDRARALERAGIGVSSTESIGPRGWEWVSFGTPGFDTTVAEARIRALLALPQVEFASPVFHAPLGQGWIAITPEVLLRLGEPYRADAARWIGMLAPGAEIVATDFAKMPGVFMLRSRSRNGFEVLDLANRLARDPRVEWAEPDMQLSARLEAVPNDPLFPDQWNLENTGQFGGVPGIDVDAVRAWDITTGSAEVKVLILDTGVQLDHPDLVGRIAGGADFTTDVGDGGPVNACDNHGTPVAGIVAATGTNGIGTSGTAPGVMILSARIFISPSDATCSGSSTVLASWIANALTWGASEGALVSNSSFRLNAETSTVNTAYDTTYSNGMVHFAAAGNGGTSTVAYPASRSSINGVSNLRADGSLNPSSDYGTLLSFSAPGTFILAPDRTGADGYNDTDTWPITGTSAASPHGAGIAALLLSVEPTLTHTEVESKLQCSARDLGSTGFDAIYGWGLLDAHAAVSAPLGVDSDSDAVDDACDNCPDDANADQADGDADGIGDSCDSCSADFRNDLDGDGLCADGDNCPETANSDQRDTNGDGVGDACECSEATFSLAGDGWLGWRVQDAGDFNGDGYQDIVAGARANDDVGANAGKAYVYSGRDGSELFILLGEATADHFGASVAGVGDLNGDGHDDVIVGAPYNDVGGGTDNRTGRAFIFFGRSSSFYPVVLSAANADILLDGEFAGDNFGWDVAPMRDVDGDTVPDFLVGALGSSGGTAGKAYVYSGADRSVIHTFFGEAAGDWFGYTVRDAGYVDLDNLPDVIVGAALHDTTGTNAGRAYVFSGAGGGLLHSIDGEAAGDDFGIWVEAAGDVDGDGRDDLLVGAPFNDAGGLNAGRGYVLSGDDGSLLKTLTGDQSFGYLGYSISSVADLDGDGIGDLAIGAPGRGVPGRLRTGVVHLYSSQTGAQLAAIGGSADGDSFGRALYSGRDIDGDGLRDLLVGAYLNDAGSSNGGLVRLHSLGDADADGFRANCDNCDTVANSDQADVDLDKVGDVCDNCPDASNSGQEDSDGDGRGDACDWCPLDPFDDVEDDGWCADVDNCPDRYNPLQLDDDGDSIGNVCDHCPAADDSFDADGDGAADGCDCQPFDPNDLPPGEIPLLQVDRGAGGSTLLSWPSGAGADLYSVTRSLLSALAPGSYGDCLASGLLQSGYEDGGMPASGDGFAYLVQGESLECGLGLMGSGPLELPRENTDAMACSGGSPFTDAYPSAESSVLGTVSGGLAEVGASDDAVQSITEELSSGGNPDNRFSQLEHRWDFTVPAGSRIELHLEGYRLASADGDDFVFEYWDGAAWATIGLPSLPVADDGDYDAVVELPATLSGALTIRVVDTVRDPGTQALDTVSIDELFVRTIPLGSVS